MNFLIIIIAVILYAVIYAMLVRKKIMSESEIETLIQKHIDDNMETYIQDYLRGQSTYLDADGDYMDVDFCSKYDDEGNYVGRNGRYKDEVESQKEAKEKKEETMV